ncbi:hypothetical protein F2Q68_00013665 [Brassica cretica]|uniref:Uncharacterized protein n=1 Tax=Brassica cretica TaxID=69181 RepID=A0A8S9HQA8_BRACR|nr:hypothetical protein F2Q68_00013665 [Brassica cretica]
MFRTAARRLLGAGFTTSRLLRLPKPRPTTIIPYSYCTSSIGNQSVNPNQSDPTATSSSTAREEGHRRDESSRKPRAEFEEEQARVLAASLRHVSRITMLSYPGLKGPRRDALMVLVSAERRHYGVVRFLVCYFFLAVPSMYSSRF